MYFLPDTDNQFQEIALNAHIFALVGIDKSTVCALS